jgi:hypothetical protein
VNNLGVFDDVAIAIEKEWLIVTVREKWTLIPSFDLATGTTLEDSFVLLGAAANPKALHGAGGRHTAAVLG